MLAGAFLALPCAQAFAQATFYEAYDQAIRAEAAGKLEEARGFLLTAIALREEPGRRVKTYGLNFLDVYDPHLHLARVAARLQRLEEAETSLARARRAAASPPQEIARVENEVAALRTRRASSTTSTPTAAPRPPIPVAAAQAPSPSPTGAPPPPDARPPDLRAPAPTSPPASVSTSRPSSTAPSFATASRRPTERPAVPTAVAPHAAPLGPETTTIVPPLSAAAPTAQKPSTPTPATAPEPAPRASLPVVGAVVGGVALVLVLGFLWRRRVVRQPAASEVASSDPSTRIEIRPARTAAPAARVSGSSHVSTISPAPVPVGNTMALGAQPGPATDIPFGEYVLEGILGQGGMGTTYRARRERDGLSMVVKVPHDHLLAKPEFVQRFVREGQLGATLHHPNIIRLFEAGEIGGRPFIAMELLEGITLEKRLEGGAPVPLAEALHVTRDVALALDYAHLKGVVHRDLKPENVMLCKDGAAKVMDYGIARVLGSSGLTATDMYLGTPLYSAPESMLPTGVDSQSDIYSLGIILYRMLTGRLPFHSTNPLDLLRMHMSEPLPPFPPGLQQSPVWDLVCRMTAKQRSDRYADAEILLRDLDAILNRL